MRHIFLILALLLTACGQHTAAIPTLKPYKMDIQQGNVITPKMMMQLRPGMTKSQVRFIMGTPLLADPFHSDRWDYFYQMRKDGKIIEQRRVILEFEGDALKRVRGDVVPAGADPSALTHEPGKVEPRSVQPKKEEKGLLDKLKFWEKDEAAQPKETPKVEPQPESKAAPAETAAPDDAPLGAPMPAIAPREESTLLPPLTEPEPVAPAEAKPKTEPAKAEGKPSAEERAVEEKPVPRKPVVKPEAKPEPKPEPKPEVQSKPAPKVESKPAPRTEPRTAPPPPDDLPPEDSPDFFEKMLEKIGF